MPSPGRPWNSDMAETTVVAVIPHFEASWDQLARLVRAVQQQESRIRNGIVIVANNPDSKVLAPFDEVAGVEVLKPGFNMGYVGALEWVRRIRSADYLWVLKEDLVPMPDCLQSLVGALEADTCQAQPAVASPVEVDEYGKATSVKRTGAWHSVEFTYLSGAVIRSQALEEVGGFDVRLWPLMFVDADTCTALMRHGYRIRLEPTAHILHDRSASSSYPRFHHWKQIASARNSRTMESKYGLELADPPNGDPGIAPDIILDLARSMSGFMLDYSAWVHATAWHGRRSGGCVPSGGPFMNW